MYVQYDTWLITDVVYLISSFIVISINKFQLSILFCLIVLQMYSFWLPIKDVLGWDNMVRVQSFEILGGVKHLFGFDDKNMTKMKFFYN